MDTAFLPRHFDELGEIPADQLVKVIYDPDGSGDEQTLVGTWFGYEHGSDRRAVLSTCRGHMGLEPERIVHVRPITEAELLERYAVGTEVLAYISHMFWPAEVIAQRPEKKRKLRVRTEPFDGERNVSLLNVSLPVDLLCR